MKWTLLSDQTCWYWINSNMFVSIIGNTPSYTTCGSVTTWFSFWPFPSKWQLGSAGPTYTYSNQSVTYHTVLDDGDRKNSDVAKCPIRIQVLHVSKLWAPLNTSVSPFIGIQQGHSGWKHLCEVLNCNIFKKPQTGHLKLKIAKYMTYILLTFDTIYILKCVKIFHIVLSISIDSWCRQLFSLNKTNTQPHFLKNAEKWSGFSFNIPNIITVIYYRCSSKIYYLSWLYIECEMHILWSFSNGSLCTMLCIRFMNLFCYDFYNISTGYISLSQTWSGLCHYLQRSPQRYSILYVLPHLQYSIFTFITDTQKPVWKMDNIHCWHGSYYSSKGDVYFPVK
jgi:hypothetical protein